MSDDPRAVSLLIQGLEEIEAELEGALRPARDGTSGQLPLEDLSRLKAAIERVRPVLLLYISGRSVPQSAPVPRATSTVSSLIEDAFHISDRYLMPKHLKRASQLRLVDNGK